MATFLKENASSNRTRLHWLLFVMPVLFTLVMLLPIAWFLDN
jgi:hypothetical protein